MYPHGTETSCPSCGRTLKSFNCCFICGWMEDNCGNCIYPDGGTCSNMQGVDGTTEVSDKNWCENYCRKN